MNKKCIRLFLSAFLVSLACVFTFSQFVSALGINGGGYLNWDNGRLENYNGSVNTPVATFNHAVDDMWVTIGDPAVFNHIILATREIIPANSLVSFTARYMVQNTSSLSFNYYGVQFEDGRTLITDSCVVNNLSTATGAIGMNMLECSYLYYSPYTTQYVDFSNGHHILEWATGSTQAGSNGAFNIVISPASYVQLTNDGLSMSDREWLATHMPAGSSQADIEEAVENAISSAGIVSAQNATTNAVNNLNLSVQEQTEQEQSQYESEKQEEAEREEAGEDDANQLLSIFNFNFSNPFAPILDSFTNQQCVNIPTIASWLHSPTAVYCSWWSESIRNVLTPVFGLASSILLFGFIISWLRGGSSSQIPTGERGIVYKTK